MAPSAKVPGTLLYVEDDADTRAALGASLARRVETLLLADNGAVGLAMFEAHAPDVVVTDITMPVLDGLAMARAIKGARREVPVIVTTAYNDTPYLLEAIEVGVDGYVLKPVDFPRLFEVVRRNFAVVDHQRQAVRHQEEQRLLLEEKTRLVEDLQGAMVRIKRLSGLLPICANCKRSRDDQGYWTAVEQYVGEHADVAFTHGICPPCVEALYPDLGPHE